MIYFDNNELKLFSQTQELTEILNEKKRILIACSKANKINCPNVSQMATEFTELSEKIIVISKNEVFSFYRKNNFFKAGVMVEFLN